jgi:phosphoadenosine phosphosulfate reductase
MSTASPVSFEPNHLAEINSQLESQSAQQRVAWALDQFKPNLVLSSSFGAQAAVCLHLATEQWPDIPVVLIDTGYLFPETYAFIDQLTEQLSLNLHIYRSSISPAWLESRYGKLWEKGVDGIKQYNQITKVEPMNRALNALDAKAWLAGLRRKQSSTRAKLHVLMQQGQRVKVHPIIDWSDRDVYQYLTKHNLPYHPLWEKGYVSIGDVHTTRRLTDGMTEDQTRFFGLVRECGLHTPAQDFSI